MKVLLTGACGFLARKLIAELEASPHGHELRLLDRVTPQTATVFVPGSAQRAEVAFESQWPFVQAEITDEAAMIEACAGVDAVIHLAASVTGVAEHGVETYRANALGTFVALDAARKGGVKCFILASSINVFGTFYWHLSGRPVEYASLPLDENVPPIPEDPYSLGKLAGEEACAAFSRAYGLTTIALRFAGVWTDEMYRRALNEGLPPTQSWSEDLFQWVHVDDIARGIRAALEAHDVPSHGVYTLGAADTRCPEPTLEIIEHLRPELRDKLTSPLPGRAPLLSIARAQSTLGYAPQHRLGP